MTRLLRVAVIWIASGTTLFAGTDATLTSGVLNPSALCGDCHRQIYEMWKRSMHAMSVTDPVFEASYMRAYRETEGKAREICLRCHAPAAVLSGDLRMAQPISREGITCDFCHSIVSVNLDRHEQPFRVLLDGVKRGPLSDAVSPAHKIAKSDLHKSPQICAGCHEYVNKAGVAILTTYTEWMASPQAKAGRICQDCHMPMTPGQTVRPSLGIYRPEINLHDISGGHSSEQVRKAATVRILRVAREEANLATVEVEVANIGSGHSIPTGLPTRRLVLEVVLFCADREVTRFERRYQKVLLDQHGEPITEDHRVMLDASAIGEDTRLRPGERRVESLVAEVPPKGPLRAEATLRYLYEPEILLRQTMSIEMGSDRSP